jgi:hypothetical protein
MEKNRETERTYSTMEREKKTRKKKLVYRLAVAACLWTIILIIIKTHLHMICSCKGKRKTRKKKKTHVYMSCNCREVEREEKNSCAHELQLEGGIERGKKNSWTHELQLQGGRKKIYKKKTSRMHMTCVRDRTIRRSCAHQCQRQIGANFIFLKLPPQEFAAQKNCSSCAHELLRPKQFVAKKNAAHVHMSCYNHKNLQQNKNTAYVHIRDVIKDDFGGKLLSERPRTSFGHQSYIVRSSARV